MSPGGKVLISAVTVGLVAGLILWRNSPKSVNLAGVTAKETYLVTEPNAGGGKKVPRGIVVFVTKVTDEWAYVTIPASIADALYDLNQDVSGWVLRSHLEDVVPR